MALANNSTSAHTGQIGGDVGTDRATSMRHLHDFAEIDFEEFAQDSQKRKYDELSLIGRSELGFVVTYW